MNFKKTQILQTLNKFAVQNGPETKQLLFTTSAGLIFGNLSYDTAPTTSNGSVNLGFVLSDFCTNTDEDKFTLESIIGNDYILLKDVTLITRHRNRFDFASYILFYENIIGVSLSDINCQDKV